MDEIRYQFEYPATIPSVFIGAGGHSFRNVLPSLQYAPVDLRAVCDLKLDRAQAYAKIFGAPEAYSDYHEMLAKEKPTAAFIVTDHKPDDDGLVKATAIAADCLRAGVNVWMEKPTAASIAEIRELMRLSEESGAILVTGMNKIFMPSIQKAKEIISTPEFGKVTSVYARYPLGLPDADGRRTQDLEMTMGFRDHVYHVGAVMNYLGGRISRMSYEWEAINHSTVASVRFESGAIGSIYFAAGSGAASPLDRFEVIGEGGNLVIENTLRLTYYRSGDSGLGSYGRGGSYIVDDSVAPMVWEPEYSLSQLYNKNIFYLGYVNEVLHFCESVLGHKAPTLGTLAQSAEVMALYDTYRRTAPGEAASVFADGDLPNL
jgi:predicted dehydrogenase